MNVLGSLSFTKDNTMANWKADMEKALAKANSDTDYYKQLHKKVMDENNELREKLAELTKPKVAEFKPIVVKKEEPKS